MKLTKEDYRSIAHLMLEGSASFVYTKDGEDFCFDYTLVCRWRVDNDYDNNVVERICMNAELTVDLDSVGCFLCGSTVRCEHDFDWEELETAVRNVFID